MIDAIRRRPLVFVAAAFLVGVLALGLIWAGTASVSSGARDDVGAQSPGPSAVDESPSATPADTSTPVASAPAECPDGGVSVGTASELEDALADASPGDVIELAAGTYIGNFVAATSGTSDAPITLCGSRDSILDGGGWDDGYVLHLDGASYWHLTGFTVTNGQKGVMADGTVGSVIQGLTVFHTGDEAVHLRRASTDNQVLGNTISDTGLRKPKFGEGIYIGTAESNWCDVSACQPDNSDRNLIEGNTISGTTSESIDVKEGTSDGVIRGNSFDGSSISGADSWVDIKGNDWLIEGNSGVNSPGDGFQTHEIIDGWGTRNDFRDNSAAVNGPGFGYSLTPVLDNVVGCGNTASSAGEGLSNVTCSG